MDIDADTLAVDLYCVIAGELRLNMHWSRQQALAWVAGVREEIKLGQSCMRYMPHCYRLAETVCNTQQEIHECTL